MIQSVNQSINQSIKRRIKQAINQSINQSKDESKNQSINRADAPGSQVAAWSTILIPKFILSKFPLKDRNIPRAVVNNGFMFIEESIGQRQVPKQILQDVSQLPFGHALDHGAEQSPSVSGVEKFVACQRQQTIFKNHELLILHK